MINRPVTCGDKTGPDLKPVQVFSSRWICEDLESAQPSFLNDLKLLGRKLVKRSDSDQLRTEDTSVLTATTGTSSAEGTWLCLSHH